MGTLVYGAFKTISISSDSTQDLWNLLGASTHRTLLHGWEVTSDTLTAELVALTLTRVTSAGTGGSSVTEERRDENDGAIRAALVTDVETPGTPSGELMGYQWEQLGPIGHIFTPEMRPIAEVSEGFALVVSTAVALVVSGWVCWEEV